MDNTKICELHSSEGIAAIVWCLKFEIRTVRIPDCLYPGMWASTPNSHRMEEVNSNRVYQSIIYSETKLNLSLLCAGAEYWVQYQYSSMGRFWYCCNNISMNNVIANIEFLVLPLNLVLFSSFVFVWFSHVKMSNIVSYIHLVVFPKNMGFDFYFFSFACVWNCSGFFCNFLACKICKQ